MPKKLCVENFINEKREKKKNRNIGWPFWKKRLELT